jgi:hypothetical protein
MRNASIIRVMNNQVTPAHLVPDRVKMWTFELGNYFYVCTYLFGA